MKHTDLPAEFESRHVMVEGVPVHYVEQGKGLPVIFLHGVPASGWIFRKVIPHLSSLCRCIVPDLAGFGQSGQPDTAYSLTDQIQLLDGLVNTLQLKRVVPVLHGWGGTAGLAWAMQHEEKCRGLVFYETWLHPVVNEHFSLPWRELIEKAQENLEILPSHGLQFVDSILRQMTLNPFDEQAMAHFCAPFAHTGAGKPLQQWLREAPTGTGQSLADILLQEASARLQQSSLPKLLLYSVPGFLVTIATIEWAKKNLPHLEIVEMGEALHFGPEIHPVRMGQTISAWLQGIEAARP